MSGDDMDWLGLRDEETGVFYMVNPRGAWRVLAQSEIDNDVIFQIENVASGESSSLVAQKISEETK